MSSDQTWSCGREFRSSASHVIACRWKACGTQQPLPADWPEALGCRQLRACQRRRALAYHARRLARMRADAAEADAEEDDTAAGDTLADSEPQADADEFGVEVGLPAGMTVLCGYS